MTNSIINGKHIPEDEWWVWQVHLRPRPAGITGPRGLEEHRSTFNHNHHYERHDNFCGKCSKPQMELFEFDSPLSGGCYTFCRECMMKVRAVLTTSKGCPVCGFGLASVGNGIHKCIFKHEWKEDGAGRKTIISPVDLPSETKEVVICGACDEWNKPDAVTCRNCGSKLTKD